MLSSIKADRKMVLYGNSLHSPEMNRMRKTTVAISIRFQGNRIRGEKEGRKMVFILFFLTFPFLSCFEFLCFRCV